MNWMDRESIRRKLEAKHDNTMREMFAGVTTTNAAPQEPLTFDRLKRLAADMRAEFGPTPMFLSSKLFPEDKTLSVENATTKYTCAGRGFWARFQHEMRSRDYYEAQSLANPLLAPMFGIQIHEIDIEDDTPPERAEYLRGVWEDLIETVKVAMTPLPDWIWNAPKFTQHG